MEDFCQSQPNVGINLKEQKMSQNYMPNINKKDKHGLTQIRPNVESHFLVIQRNNRELSHNNYPELQ